ncbi:efflux transporter outer membrane subunit [Methylocystis parvus]|uniref:Efflux transporter outer membrane subunit n=1 Tax=Methylocystis parvus TaxID=134 RepID=A0A6B8MA66_9HYPH|nr:efflux transporter outer membrane subunit [Methylocystis parvus]QGM97550.1 efflux transporter outer membrane subunit [Methylocystis parvus]WBJ98524.1 efflux transporter outer membrane subunit [Methylocystis parvus OBBP]
MRRRSFKAFATSKQKGAFPALGLALALGGCAVGPDFNPPEAALQDNWIEKGDKRVANKEIKSDWWRTFHDPTLDRLVHLAAEQNLPVQIAGLRILEARAQLGIAIGQLFPQDQGGSGAATWNKISEQAANKANLPKHAFGDFSIGFDATWEIDFWGRYRRGVEAADASMMRTIADYDNALVSLTAEVARTYVTIRTFEVLLEIAQENVRLQKDGLQIAEARFRAGATSELDVAQQKALLQNTIASIPELQTGLQQAKNALSVLLGQPPGGIEKCLHGAQKIPSASPRVSVGVPAELLRRRPDIRAAEMNAAAESARIGIAESDLYPRFFLFGDIGVQASDLGKIFAPGSLFLTAGPSFRWSILNYGRIANNIRAQDARLQQALVNYQDIVIKAAREAEDALIAFLKGQQRAAALQKSVEAAQRAVELSFIQYREGAENFQRVLDAQTRLLDERNRLAETRSSIATNLVALYKALGGGWEIGHGKPIVPEVMQAGMMNRTDWGNLLPAQTPPPAANLPLPTPAGETPLLLPPDYEAAPMPPGRPAN